METKNCENCGNGPYESEKCLIKTCVPVRLISHSFANWIPKPEENVPTSDLCKRVNELEKENAALVGKNCIAEELLNYERAKVKAMQGKLESCEHANAEWLKIIEEQREHIAELMINLQKPAASGIQMWRCGNYGK
jgi:hypothetical protein